MHGTHERKEKPLSTTKRAGAGEMRSPGDCNAIPRPFRRTQSKAPTATRGQCSPPICPVGPPGPLHPLTSLKQTLMPAHLPL